MSVTTVVLTANFFEETGVPYQNVKLEAELFGIDVETQQYVALSRAVDYSDPLGTAQLNLFSNAAGSRLTYYRIKATAPNGVIISDSNVTIPATDCNLSDVEGNWSGEIFAGGPSFIVPLKNFADDAAAAAGGIPLDGMYRTAGAVKVRIV